MVQNISTRIPTCQTRGPRPTLPRLVPSPERWPKSTRVVTYYNLADWVAQVSADLTVVALQGHPLEARLEMMSTAADRRCFRDCLIFYDGPSP